MTTKGGVKRKAANNHYTPEVRAKIAKYATVVQNTATSLQHASLVNNSKFLIKVKQTSVMPSTHFLMTGTFHTPDNHWSTVDSMIRYIENVLVLYTDKGKEELDLPIRQHAVAVVNIFCAHRCEEVLDALSKDRIQHVFVPAGCTGELQPMDLSVNRELKTALKNEFAKKMSKTFQTTLQRKLI